MLKVLFVYIGKLMLAGAYGWKRASELSLYAHVGATLYFDAWVLCLLFCGIESKDQILSIVISILFPLLYIAFVAFIRIKNKKLKKHETVQPDNAIEESPSEASKPISDADIKTCLKENSEESPTNRILPVKTIVVSILSVCLVVSVATNIWLGVTKNKQISKLNTEIETLNASLIELQEHNESQEKLINQMSSKEEDQANRIEWLQERNKEIIKELNFYQTFAVCVNRGSSLYHKYKCSKFDTSYFWIYNIDYAQSIGYNPCSICCD